MKTDYKDPKTRYEEINKKYERETAPVPAEKESNGPHTINGKLWNAKKVRIRKAPSMQAAELTVLDNGTIVELLSTTDHSMFYKVKTDSGLIGYVHKEFCKIV